MAITVIKKYSNRRLYNTDLSEYITQEMVKDYVREGLEFKIVDAKTDEDLTSSVLLQIITEQHAAGASLFTQTALRQLICVGEHPARAGFGPCLENSIKLFFAQQQGDLQAPHLVREREYSEKTAEQWQAWMDAMWQTKA